MNWMEIIMLAVKAAGPVVIPPLLAELEKLDTPTVNPIEKIALEAAIAWLKSQTVAPAVAIGD